MKQEITVRSCDLQLKPLPRRPAFARASKQKVVFEIETSVIELLPVVARLEEVEIDDYATSALALQMATDLGSVNADVRNQLDRIADRAIIDEATATGDIRQNQAVAAALVITEAQRYGLDPAAVLRAAIAAQLAKPTATASA